MCILFLKKPYKSVKRLSSKNFSTKMLYLEYIDVMKFLAPGSVFQRVEATGSTELTCVWNSPQSFCRDLEISLNCFCLEDIKLTFQ